LKRIGAEPFDGVLAGVDLVPCSPALVAAKDAKSPKRQMHLLIVILMAITPDFDFNLAAG
jgi:hypothetical protein